MVAGGGRSTMREMSADGGDGRALHRTAGALIERSGRYLVIRKGTWPYLWDVVAGHIQGGEEPMAAARREVREEVGLILLRPRLAWRGVIYPDPCRRGAVRHEWYLFRAGARGNLKCDRREVRQARWATIEEMARLPFVRPAYWLFDAIGLWQRAEKSQLG